MVQAIFIVARFVVMLGRGLPRPAVQRHKFDRTDANTHAPVGANDPVRPAVHTHRHERANANPYHVYRGRCPHRPAQRTRKITPIALNCQTHQICVGEGFYPSRAVRCCGYGRTNAEWYAPVGADDPVRPAGCTTVFYETHRQIRNCPTGGQSRPPLQDVVRCRRALCNFAIAYRRVDVGIDPYRRIALSPFVVQICGCILRGRGKPLPYVTTKWDSLNRFDQTRRLCCNPLFPSRKPQMLLRGRLDAHVIRWDAQLAGDVFAHGC